MSTEKTILHLYPRATKYYDYLLGMYNLIKFYKQITESDLLTKLQVKPEYYEKLKFEFLDEVKAFIRLENGIWYFDSITEKEQEEIDLILERLKKDKVLKFDEIFHNLTQKQIDRYLAVIFSVAKVSVNGTHIWYLEDS